jgi:hypothetical protein
MFTPMRRLAALGGVSISLSGIVAQPADHLSKPMGTPAVHARPLASDESPQICERSPRRCPVIRGPHNRDREPVTVIPLLR